MNNQPTTTNMENTNKKSVKQVLEDAATYIEKVGWNQDAFFDSDADDGGAIVAGVPCCVRGAIWAVDPDGHNKGRGPAVRAVLDYVNANPDPDDEIIEYEDLAEWNDTLWRTKDEVVATLRTVAASVGDKA